MNSDSLERFVVPEAVVSHFHIRSGETVADFGAGSGYFIQILAAAVGPQGIVYACDVQKPLVEAMGELARSKHLEQVRVLWSDLEEEHGVALQDNTVDVGILVNTLFQLEDKAAAMAEMCRTLRSGGKLCIIDWSESFGGLGPRQQDIVSMADARAAAESAGLVFERDFPAGAHHYGLTFRKP